MHVLPWPLVPVIHRAAHVPSGPVLRRPHITSISRSGLHWAAAFAPRALRACQAAGGEESKDPAAFAPFATRRALHPPFRIPRQQPLRTRLIPPPSSAAAQVPSGRRAGRLWRGRWGG